MEYQRTTSLSHEQARELCALYQDEWWTVGRTLGDVLSMIENSLVFGMVAPSGEPELEPFYERWGFSRDVSGVGFMRRVS